MNYQLKQWHLQQQYNNKYTYIEKYKFTNKT